ncbi:hypothetical protein BD410DRAFT_792367 [Rickenella mellea]|uniref:HNH nuclease domain-containing protein n=1 Tax=Rickenella mellea TaxID=50990 RepID=A0A4Y7PW16_9AGAM|nr:hypothetical protein BD410DRAFT_792367 [Rickenella mellea]
MTSLPRTLPERLQQHPRTSHIASAYGVCLKLEASLQVDTDNGKDVGRGMIYCRILGYLLHYVPGELGLRHLVSEIVSCDGDTSLLKLGQMYFNHYIRAFRARKGRTPSHSSHASRPSFDRLADMIKANLVKAPQSHADAKTNALIRDGFRCVVTGRYDRGSANANRELKDAVDSDPNARLDSTECAHIFAESTNSAIEPGSDKRNYAATMWAIMTCFGHAELPKELNGPKVHRLENVMTLCHDFHTLFDNLDVWFVPTNEKNKYKLGWAWASNSRDYPEHVIFKTSDETNLPVPSPNYLAIHAACAKVAHLSGAAQCIDKLYQDLDDSTTLDPNGASAEILEHALYQVMVS